MVKCVSSNHNAFLSSMCHNSSWAYDRLFIWSYDEPYMVLHLQKYTLETWMPSSSSAIIDGVYVLTCSLIIFIKTEARNMKRDVQRTAELKPSLQSQGEYKLSRGKWLMSTHKSKRHNSLQIRGVEQSAAANKTPINFIFVSVWAQRDFKSVCVERRESNGGWQVCPMRGGPPGTWCQLYQLELQGGLWDGGFILRG